MARLEIGFDSSHFQRQQMQFDPPDAPGEATPMEENPRAAASPPDTGPEPEDTTKTREIGDESFADFRFPADSELSQNILIPLSSGSGHRHTRACPKCGNLSLHRSHTRSLLEDIRKQVSGRRPYRCNKCQWRGWLLKE